VHPVAKPGLVASGVLLVGMVTGIVHDLVVEAVGADAIACEFLVWVDPRHAVDH